MIRRRQASRRLCRHPVHAGGILKDRDGPLRPAVSLPFMQACKAACSHLLSTRGEAAGRALCAVKHSPEQQRAWATPRLRHMGVDGRAMALGAAAALGLTLTWLHRRGSAARHRSGGGNNNNNHCRGVKLVPRGRPLVAQPDEVSLVSYNILCERCAGEGGSQPVAAGARAAAAPIPLASPLPQHCGRFRCLLVYLATWPALLNRRAAAVQVCQCPAAAARVCAIPGSRLPLGAAAGVWKHKLSCWV